MGSVHLDYFQSIDEKKVKNFFWKKLEKNVHARNVAISAKSGEE